MSNSLRTFGLFQFCRGPPGLCRICPDPRCCMVICHCLCARAGRGPAKYRQLVVAGSYNPRSLERQCLTMTQGVFHLKSLLGSASRNMQRHVRLRLSTDPLSARCHPERRCTVPQFMMLSRGTGAAIMRRYGDPRLSGTIERR